MLSAAKEGVGEGERINGRGRVWSRSGLKVKKKDDEAPINGKRAALNKRGRPRFGVYFLKDISKNVNQEEKFIL
jgi:hypothetical protein